MAWKTQSEPATESKPLFDPEPPLPNNKPIWDEEPIPASNPILAMVREPVTNTITITMEDKNPFGSTITFPQVNSDVPLPDQQESYFWQANSQVQERKEQASAIEPPKPEEPNPLTLEDFAALWLATDDQLAIYKARELELRNKIIAMQFADKGAGTFYADLPEGWRIKYNGKLNYKLDSVKTAEALKNFTEDVASLLVKWEYTLSVSNYNLLNDEAKALFADALTTKPGQASLELVPPKVKK